MSNSNFNVEDEAKDNEEPKIRTIKEHKKENKEIGKKYIKAKYNYHFGYRFKAFNNYIKKNLKYFFTKYIKPIIVILLVLTVIFLGVGIAKIVEGTSFEKETEKYESTNKALESKEKDLEMEAQNQNKKIDSKNVSTQTGVQRAKKVFDDVLNGMYSYDNADEYNTNRENNMKHIENPDEKWVGSVYSDAKDDDGNSQIETLNLSSDLDNSSFFTKNPDDTKEKVVPFKVVVSHTGYIDDVSSDYATRTHYTTYKVDFDTSTNKIKHMKKVNSVKVNNDIS